MKHNLTQHEYDEFYRQTGHRHPWDRSCPSIQKQEDNMRKTTSNSPKSTAMDGVSYEGYSLSVEILVSDRRRRDLDGALATICDCIVAAGRQLAADTDDSSEGKDGKEGR